MEFGEIVQRRYAVKKFDGSVLPKEKVDELLEMVRLAPSSFNIQPWKTIVIADQAVKDALLEHSWNQPQVTTCSHLLVMCADTDVLGHIDQLEAQMKEAGTPEEKLSAYVGIMRQFTEKLSTEAKLSWAQRQVYIALSHAMNGATALGFHSCPMEGFSAPDVTRILELPENLVPTVLCPIGVPADEARPKLRFPTDSVIEWR